MRIKMFYCLQGFENDLEILPKEMQDVGLPFKNIASIGPVYPRNDLETISLPNTTKQRIMGFLVNCIFQQPIYLKNFNFIKFNQLHDHNIKQI